MLRNLFRILNIAFYFTCITTNGVNMKIPFSRIFICHKPAFLNFQGGQTRIAAMPMSVRTRPYTQEAHLPVADFSCFPGCLKTAMLYYSYSNPSDRRYSHESRDNHSLHCYTAQRNSNANNVICFTIVRPRFTVVPRND